MAIDLSFDAAGKLLSSTIKGVASTPAGSTPNKILGSAATAAGRVSDGLIKSGRDIAGSYVGGAENLKMLESGASSIASTVSDLWNGETTFTEVGEKIKSSVGSLFDADSASSILSENVDSLLGLRIANTDLGSNWGNLSPYLLARIFVCNSKGVPDIQELQGVYGAMEEGSFEATFNWQSPFENMGPETKAPALTALLQSGSLVPVLNALQAVNPNPNGTVGGVLDAGADKLKAAVRELEGRTGMTKLNSRQVFTGMPPVRMNFSLVLRAISDAAKEVEAPLQRLMEWVFPQELAEEGILSEVLQTTRDVDSFIKALFPSYAPKLLGMTYAGRTAAPMVVESISYPLSAPKDSRGNYTELTVQVSMATLTALDRPDIKRFFARLG
ncbi:MULTISPECIES: hypothetical protein [unclassified Pseudomonas]|uniref:hypothetical protein n=1 Tax=unclassified Pseudomonas TaxID=196821 RepID=UPI00117B71B9|nr:MULTISPECIES: hypothetical protein [unclassified Pseudomonas]